MDPSIMKKLLEDDEVPSLLFSLQFLLGFSKYSWKEKECRELELRFDLI